MTRRQTNLLGALVLALSDRMQVATESAAGRGGRAPAALAVLLQQDGLCIEGLRRQLDLSQPATVRLVDGLVGDGLAERRAGQTARTIEIVLTEAGRERAGAVLAVRRAAIDGVLGRLSTLERLQLEPLLERLLDGLRAGAAVAEARAAVVCRLCDCDACPRGRCPVNRAADLPV